MNVAIIPARGGSKRIPKKNIKLFAGKPIISFSINAAKESDMFDKIIVSTDSKEIAAIAIEYGAEVPFIRPHEISDDYATTSQVLLHALQWLAEHEMQATYACCIYATAPFIKPEYIKQGFEILIDNNVSSAFSITSFPFPIFRALRATKNGGLAMFWPENELARSQDLPESYHDAGQFYWMQVESFLHHMKLFPEDAMPVKIPRYLVQDIDTEEDWITAERMFKALEI